MMRLVLVLVLAGCGGVTVNPLTATDAGGDRLPLEAGLEVELDAGVDQVELDAGLEAGAPWGPAGAPACRGELAALTDCQRPISGPAGGWQCARACATELGADLAAGGACVAHGVTFCVSPRDGGDPCADCAP